MQGNTPNTNFNVRTFVISKIPICLLVSNSGLLPLWIYGTCPCRESWRVWTFLSLDWYFLYFDANLLYPNEHLCTKSS